MNRGLLVLTVIFAIACQDVVTDLLKDKVCQLDLKNWKFEGYCPDLEASQCNGDSCDGRCGDVLDNSCTCQCNDQCQDFGDCCGDYGSLCLGQAGSCEGRCGENLDPDQSCQCNDECSEFGDCCDDYDSLCLGQSDGSCEGRCGENDPSQSCQCNDACVDFGDCCSDYNELCGGGTGGGDVSDADLASISELLLNLEINNGNQFVELDFQGSTSSCGPDNAPSPLFSSFDRDSILALPTVAALAALYDNYDVYEDNSEDRNTEERAEEDAFLDEVFATPVWLSAYDFITSNGLYVGSDSEFRSYLNELWFGNYQRGAPNSSSGFEHVFLGEIDGGSVGGFHSWIHYGLEEEAGNIDYSGWIVQATSFGSNARGITNSNTWLGADKCTGGFFIGTSPELDFSLFTICALARPGQQCDMSFSGERFSIQTYVDNNGGNDNIGSAYPIFY